MPRKIGTSGSGWLVAVGLLIAWTVLYHSWDPATRATEQVDTAILRQFARLRTDWLTDVMSFIDRLGSGWAVTVVGVALIVLLMVFRRWRHLFTFLGSVVALALVGGELFYDPVSRARPYGVTTIGSWAGFSFPSPPTAILAILAIAITYSLVVPGRPRAIAKAVSAAVVGIFVFARLYLAVDHPFDIAVGIALAVAIPLIAFRIFTPNDVFPVKYRSGKSAHLDVGGRRGEAIRRALEDQLGLTVVSIAPVGLAGSGGSTPLKIRVAGTPDTVLFGKLYAMSHVRADRWYKLGRTLLYGRLEDEAPFQSVRRLVQYEDYTLRLLRDSGITTAAPYGIVEITPEREYLIVTEFFEGAQELGEAEVDDAVIDDGLMLIRRLWDAGLAHRDIKPANLLVRDGKVLVIDVAFVQARPSPWRQAVDLANMMLVLAVRTDAPRVYERALALFTADEIAEAFAAAHGIASPSQLRAAMKQDGRNLVAQFRELAPARRPIALQRWSIKRVLLAAALAVGAWLAVDNVILVLTPAEDLEVTGTPSCGTGDLMVLMAQAVPSASSVPCILSFPAGWTLGGVRVRSGRATFWLNSDRAGDHAVEATLVAAERCHVDGAVQVPSDEEGAERLERPEQLPPNLRSTRVYRFPGGCVTYTFSSTGGSTAALLSQVDSALTFQHREPLVRAVDDLTGLSLCGTAAPPCPGDTS